MVEAEERLAMMQQQPQLDQVVTMLDTAKEMLEPRSQQHQQPGNNVSMQTEIRYGVWFEYFICRSDIFFQIFLPFPLSVRPE